MIENRSSLLVLLLLALASACSGDTGAAAASEDEPEVARRKGPPYQPAPLSAAGTIVGTVTRLQPSPATEGLPAAATAPAVPDPRGATACAANPASPEVIVYLEGITRGRPLPSSTPRRYGIAAEPCGFTPRHLVAAAGGTLNISNDVGAVHRVSFTFEGMKSPLLRIPFSNHGQLVPSETVLAVPGLVTVTSDQAPGVQARILVVEHPYAVTSTDGGFRLDSVPPGSYSLVAVTSNGRVTSPVTVQAGATTAATLQLSPR